LTKTKTSFVSALHIPCSEPEALISGGGDAELKVWDWKEGKVKWGIRIWDVVERFLVVNALRRRQGLGEEGEVGEGQGEEKNKSGGKKGRRKKSNKKVEGDVEDAEESSEMSKVLVVQNIESMSSSSGVYVLFSAVGFVVLFAYLRIILISCCIGRLLCSASHLELMYDLLKSFISSLRSQC